MNSLVFIISFIAGFGLVDIIYKFIKAYSDKRTKNEAYQRGLKDGIRQGLVSRDNVHRQLDIIEFTEEKTKGTVHCHLIWWADKKPYED